MISKLLLYLGMLLLVGGVMARCQPGPCHPRLRWLGLGWLLLVLGASLNVFQTLHALDALSLADAIQYLTGVEAGRSAVLTLLGACILLAAELSGLSWLALLGAAGVALWGLAGMGHGASHGDGVRLLHTLHAGAMTLWLGGIVALLSRKALAPADARRFTPVALGCVLTLLLSGTVLVQKHAGNPLQFFWLQPQTAYHSTLVLKLMFFGLSLLAAGVMHQRLIRQRHVRAALVAELLLLLSVLGLTSQLTQLEPPLHQLQDVHSH